MKTQTRSLLNLALALALLFSLLAPLGVLPVFAASPDIVISQVYGGGGNSGGVYSNDFVELYNRGTVTVSLAGWSIQYASATGTGNFGANSGQLTPLSGSLAPGQYLLIQEAAGSNVIAPLPTPDVTDSTPINMSGTGGKVALVTSATGLGCNGGSTPCSAAQLALIKDLVGWDGANFYETTGTAGTGPAPATTNSTAILRLLDGAQDTDNNSADFVVGAPNPRNSLFPFAATGLATPSEVVPGDSTLLTVTVTPGKNPGSTGIAVSCDLGPIGGSASQILFDDGTNGDQVAGDNTFSFSTTDTTPGTQNLTCSFADAEGRSGTTTITLTLLTVIPIGVVNGPVLDTDNGTEHVSPYVGQTVTIQGVIYEKTLQAISNSTNSYKGFYIQNTAATADSDPNTSDGLFVFMSTFSDLIGGYVPAVGDEIVLSGRVSEYYNMTELTSSSLIKLVRSDVNIDGEVAPVVANPPISLADANRYWERLQGMRVQVPQDSIVLGGRNVFNPADAEIWIARPDSTIALRPDVYTRRAFRDAHPLDDNYDPSIWDGNGYRMLMGSLGIKATAGDAQALIDPGRTFDTVTNAPAGGLNYTFSKYRIEISQQPTFSQGPDPAANNPPQVFDRSIHYSIVDYNLENLYDFRDNPFSGCDFAGNTGCSNSGTPFLSPISPPYDYVPASDAAYQARLNDIALQVINDLHSPDILMVQEVENQDFCTVSGVSLTCGTTDNADGKPDVLQELALKVASLGGPAYDAAFDRDSSDLRGIAPAFLYRTDRVELLPAAGDPLLGASPAIPGYTAVPYDSDISNPKTLNAVYTGASACETSWVFPRAPDIGLFRIFSNAIDVGSHRDVYVINNHFKSGPDSCVAHRTEQAKYNAALVAYIQAAKPDARIVVGGDLNVYPRPDDPFAPVGEPGSSDQLGSLYNPSLGLTNLWDVLLVQAPEADYSYVYLGMAQTLDQMFINQPQLSDLAQFRTAHINSDFPADYPGDVARGTSDHDPNVATFVINDPPTVDAGGPYAVIEGGFVTLTATGTDPEGQPLTFAWDLDNNGSFETPGQSVTFDASQLTAPSSYTVKVRATDNGGLTAVDSATVNVIFNWTGFFQPIDNLPIFNLVKAGSAIPVKFSLGGDKGSNIFAAGFPQSTTIACDSSVPSNIENETVNSGGSSLTYDPLTDQYTYVWKTDKAWTGTCRQLVVTLVDGTTHVANFMFK
jgi:predicted extracellular nuclease